MSDSNSERESSPPSSRKTQRYQQVPKEADPIRRNILKVIGGAGLLGAFGFGLSRLFQTGSSPETRRTPPYTRIEPTNLPLSVEQKTYVDRLQTLNQEIAKNPQGFKEIAPRVGSIAIEYFCKELGYNPNRYQGKINYEWADEYQRSRENESGCIVRQNFEDEYARVNADTNYITINLDKVLYNNLRTKVQQPYPAFAMFITLIHELHHLTSPALPNPGSTDPQEKVRGLGILKPKPELNKPGLICFDAFRVQLEEAVVHDSTVRMVTEKLGFSIEAADDFNTWVSRYRMGVIDRFFGGDNKPLLKLHQSSKPVEFFTLIGEKYGAPIDKAAEAGENYVKDLILQGIM